MIWVDLGIVVVLTGMAIVGFRRGLVRQIVELVGLILGLFLGLYLTAGLVEDYAGPLQDYRVTQPVVFMLIVGILSSVKVILRASSLSVLPAAAWPRRILRRILACASASP